MPSALPPVAGVTDEGLARWVAELRRSPGPSCRTLGAVGLRAAAQARASTRLTGPSLPIVEDLSADGGLPLRLYRPSVRPQPLVVYLHGGGFVTGDLDSHDRTCRRLAQIAAVAVLAVDYRLAPEHPGPAAVEDAVTAFEWACRRLPELGGGPPGRVALAGDSAGATVALLAALRLRNRAGAPCGLLLACPNADLTLSEPSVESEGHGWGLEADDLRWFVEQWVPDPARRGEPELSPRHADVAGLPPTIIATAEHDPLRDEGDALARQLRGAGVEVEHVPHAGLVHGFVVLDYLSASIAEAGRELFCRFGRLLRPGS